MKRIGLIVVVFVSVLITGCVSSTESSSPNDSSIDAATSEQNPSSTDSTRQPDPPLTFDEGTGPADLMRNLAPRGGQPVFLGVANRLQNREEERDAAILHIAEQGSRYVRIRASYQFISEHNTSSIGYLDNIDTTWDTEFADSLVESVEVFYETSDNAGTYILGTVSGVPAPPAFSAETQSGAQEPVWINNPPQFPGYLTSVGVVTPSRRFRDSVDRADQEALKGLLQQTGTTIRMIEDRKEEERTGTQMQVTTAQEASATLRSFYVLSRYASPDKRYYYSLAIAREE